MSDDFGAAPAEGFAPLAPELTVADLDKSVGFWCDLIGFEPVYGRKDEGFIFLRHPDGAQLMLYAPGERAGAPTLRASAADGVLLQIVLSALLPVHQKLGDANWALERPLAEVWRRWGDRQGGRKEIVLRDPDGYRLMLAEFIGERPL